jgi:cation transport protein ChaC
MVCNSEDHRGTPEAPGRVATLIDHAHWETLTDHVSRSSNPASCPNPPTPEYLTYTQHESTERVWGAAYHIQTAHVAAVRSYLDIREINGYSIQFTPFQPATPSDPVINCLVYIGLPSNPQFLGPQDPDELARHILKSKGPSGENREYLFQLEEALVELSPESGDAHVGDLVRRCREIEAGGEGGGLDGPLRRVGSTGEQEEVEK